MHKWLQQIIWTTVFLRLHLGKYSFLLKYHVEQVSNKHLKLTLIFRSFTKIQFSLISRVQINWTGTQTNFKKAGCLKQTWQFFSSQLNNKKKNWTVMAWISKIKIAYTSKTQKLLRFQKSTEVLTKNSELLLRSTLVATDGTEVLLRSTEFATEGTEMLLRSEALRLTLRAITLILRVLRCYWKVLRGIFP